nr:response regulator [Calditrichia bacterium]
EAFDSQIKLQSEPGRGSVFYFDIDLQISKIEVETSRDQSPAAAKSLSLNGTRVLLVEDNLVNIKVAKRFLDKWEARVEVARDGLEAIARHQAEDFDLILMDLHMPRMGGVEACKKIRALENPTKSSVPIIALTASALVETQNEVQMAGMNDYVTKPFNPKVLFQTITSILSGK